MKINVRPLDDDKSKGWHDDNGRFCLPLSFGYYVKFPMKNDKAPIFMAWYHNSPVGGSSSYGSTVQIAQDHHQRRVLSEVDGVEVPEGWELVPKAPAPPQVSSK